MTESTKLPCRLCGSDAFAIFKKRALGRYDVGYYRCTGCNSMQTELPYWLDEAYAIPGVHIDVGCAARTIKNWLGLTTLLERIAFPLDAEALDYGAATGLLGRMMRDVGYNFRSYDKFARPSFTSYYNVVNPADTQPRLITAFEVFEHLPFPRQELSNVFSMGASLIPFTTWFCDGQGEDWIYFVPECGQHVFFYSEDAMRWIAERHGYTLMSSSFFHLLVDRKAFTPQQFETILEFCYYGPGWAQERAASLVNSVIWSNEFIDGDFNQARLLFEAERAGS